MGSSALAGQGVRVLELLAPDPLPLLYLLRNVSVNAFCEIKTLLSLIRRTKSKPRYRRALPISLRSNFLRRASFIRYTSTRRWPLIRRSLTYKISRTPVLSFLKI